MERQAMCLNRDCRQVTTDYTMLQCSSCGCHLLIIPKTLDNSLFQAINNLVLNHYNLDLILNRKEDGAELYAGYEKVATIRNWVDFKRFFGMMFYRMYSEYDEGTDSTE